MKFRFPIVIIDEDFRSENTSGLGIRALAQAIETEGFEVLGVTSYGDLSQFAQQQSRASAFILSIDDEEFTVGPDLDPAVLSLRSFIGEVRPFMVHNSLRFGLLYLSETACFQLLSYYARKFPNLFAEAIRMVDSSDVWERRAALDGSGVPSYRGTVQAR